MSVAQRLSTFVLGKPSNPIKLIKEKKIYLVALLAWIGLGADALSSSCYGPAEAFIALGSYTNFSLYIAIAIMLTVFIICLSYNQVIELFPTGGGGYRVATTLLGPLVGLISGSALIVDYILTIVISIASGVDALFSLLPLSYQPYKLLVEMLGIGFLVTLNLRGVKESIKILAPIFLLFFVSHVFVIIYGISMHAYRIPTLITTTIDQTFSVARDFGWIFLISLLLRTYSLGSGTYTGIEAVSNNIQVLKEPKVKTAKWTMFYMASSLSFIAGGLILLYLLWNVTPQPGMTLNAITFINISSLWQWENPHINTMLLSLFLFFEAAILFVGANTGFLSGPTVMANMSVDNWFPSQFRLLSSRLVIRNSLLFLGAMAIGILILTQGKVSFLVVLYSINVFITFSLSLLGLCVYWVKARKSYSNWLYKFSFSCLGFCVTTTILMVVIIEKFQEGGWMTLFITSLFIAISLTIKYSYNLTEKRLAKAAKEYYEPRYLPTLFPPEIDPAKPTAIIFVDHSIGIGMHTLRRIQALFPNFYKNFVFLGIGEINIKALGHEAALKNIYQTVHKNLNYFVHYCHSNNLAAVSYQEYATDPIAGMINLAKEIKQKFPNGLFFSTELIFESTNWLTRLLYNDSALIIQRNLHQNGLEMVLLPVNLK